MSRNHFTARRLMACALLVALTGLAAFASSAPHAQAQSAVVGSADFRNAPQLVNGQHADRLVTGDSAWYSVVYTNNTAYDFSVDFLDANPGSEIDLAIRFVAPTLTLADGPGSSVRGNGFEYPAGSTNVWFLEVSLETTAQTGVEYPVVITVQGVEEWGVADCADIPGCSLDDEYSQLNSQITETTQALEQAQALEKLQDVESEIDNQLGFADSFDTLEPPVQARLGRAQATMAQLCAPDPMCDEFPPAGSVTPLTGWIVGLLALGFGALQMVNKLGRPSDDGDQPPPRRISALDRANDAAQSNANQT